MNSLFRSHMSGSRESADRICEHEFDLLGQEMKFGKHIDWEFGASKDIKIPWELSRFQFLGTLCRAYEIHHEVAPFGRINELSRTRFVRHSPELASIRLGLDEKYAKEARNLIHDFLLKNPVGHSVNWQCTMDVAIRACNLGLAWSFLKNSPSWNVPEWRKTFLSSLEEHGKFISQNLEYGRGFNTNHLIADLAGLFWLGVLFPEFEEAEKWKKKALEALEEEMQKQIYEDGVDFEASIPYHRLVCEFFGYSTLLAKTNGIEFSPTFLERLERMFEFVWYYTKTNGLAPQIGDNDDGRLFIFEDFYSLERRDHRHLFWLAEALFPKNKKFVRDEGDANTKKESKSFGKGGIYIMREDDFYCIVDCGPNGQNGNGGHAHNDTLSFELAIQGEDFIIDPGAFVYTGDRAARRKFRGTRMHNTVMIDRKEQNRFRLFRLFGIKNDAIPKVHAWKSDESHDFLDAEHSGYERLRSPVTHRRTFQFDKKNRSLEIKDFFTGEGTHEFEWNFHFAPGVTVSLSNRGTAVAVAPTSRRGINEVASLRLGLAEKNGKKIEMILPRELAAHAEIREDFVSPRYGVKEKAKVLTIRINTSYNSSKFYTFAIR